MRTVTLPNGEAVAVLGLGTWYMGDRGGDHAAEANALRLGLDLGMTLIDTAEMYASGGAERVVGAALAGRRDGVFVVSKVLPHNASRAGTIKACEESLTRMGIDTIDLYLLHWPGPHPLRETVEAFESLKAAGKIRHWGVSNFDTDDMEALMASDGEACAVNQVLYNLTRRGTEYDLLPWCEERGVPVIAYSPLEQGRLAGDPTLATIAARHGVAAMQIALAWVLRRDGVIAIPKAVQSDHVRENHAVLAIELDDRDLVELDQAFPPPRRKQGLEIL